MDFDTAVDMVRCGSLPDVSNSVKLKLYGLYKLATEGSPGGRTVGGDAVSKAKRQAWEEAASVHSTREAAREEYARLVSVIFLA